MENKDIYKVLAELEQTLEGVNSARKQVDDVLKTGENLNKKFTDYQKGFDDFSLSLKNIVTSNHTDFVGTSNSVLIKLQSDVELISNQFKEQLENEISKVDHLIEQSLLKATNSSTAQLNKFNECQNNLQKVYQQMNNVKDVFTNLTTTISASFSDKLDSEIDKFDEHIKQSITQIISAHEEELRRLQECYSNYTLLLENMSQTKNSLESLVELIEKKLKTSVESIEANFKKNNTIQYIVIALILINICISLGLHYFKF